jgi:hypothetical protein
VCALVSASLASGDQTRVSVGLEIEESNERVLCHLDPEAEAAQLLSHGEHWRLEDGRASEAILRLIRFVRRRERCKLFCFDRPVAAPRGSPAHSQAMAAAAARHVRSALDAGGQVILLAGSAHCRVRGGTTLGALLRERFPQTVSLVVRWPEGSRVFSYDPANRANPFGVHALAPTGAVPRGAGVTLRFEGAQDFDGQLELGTALTPSPPARRTVGLGVTTETPTVPQALATSCGCTLQ